MPVIVTFFGELFYLFVRLGNDRIIHRLQLGNGRIYMNAGWELRPEYRIDQVAIECYLHR